MNDIYREKLGIPANHTIHYVSSESNCRRGWDTDIYIYEERDENGKVIGLHEIKDATCSYPPQKRNITSRKLS